MDLATFYRGEVSARWLAVRVSNLPPGAALWRAQRINAAWAPEAHILAAAVDALRGANWQRAADSKAPRPEPYPRPADELAAQQRVEREMRSAAAFKRRQEERRRRLAAETTGNSKGGTVAAERVGGAYLEVEPKAVKDFGSKLERQISGDSTKAGTASGKAYATGFNKTGVTSVKKLLAGIGFGYGAKKIVDGLVGVTKSAAALDGQMREVVTLFGETGKAADTSLAFIRKGVRGISDDLGIAQTTLTSGLYQAISAGVPKKNAFGFLRIAAKASVAGVTDVETAVDGLTTTLNAFQLDASQARAVSDSMFAAVKGGKTTFRELSDSLFNVAPAAATAKVSYREVNAAIATLTAQGTPTSVATTQIRAALVGLQRPNEQVAKSFKAVGFESAQQAIKQKGLAFALGVVKQASKGNNGQLMQMLGSVEAVAAANVIAGTGAKKFREELDRQRKSAGSTGDAFKEIASGPQKDFQRLQTQLTNIGIELGNKLLPAAVGGANAISDFLQEMKDGTGVGGDFAEVLGDTASFAKAVGHAIDGLPGPVKKYGAEALILAIALGRVNAGLVAGRAAAGRWVTSLTTAEAGATRLNRASFRLGSGLGNLAGAAGFLAITDGAHRSNRAISALELTAGGAAAGFAVGGPVGAGIGAGAGAFFGLAKAIKRTETATNNVIAPTKTYIDTLRTGTNAVTGYTRALVAKKAQESGAIDAGRKLGLSSKTVTDAILGRAKAVKAVEAAQRKADKVTANTTKIAYDQYGNIKAVSDTATKAQQEQIRAASELGQAIGRNQSVLKADIIANNERALALGKYAKVLPGLNKTVQTRIDQIGLEKAESNIVRLTRTYGLTPKQVETVLRAAGVVPTAKQIQGVIDKANAYGRLRPSAKLDADTQPAKTKVNNLVSFIRNALTGNFSANVSAHTSGAGGLDVALNPGGKTQKRAGGGPVNALQTYLVGEKGPELFTPSTSGHIISNAATSNLAKGRPFDDLPLKTLNKLLDKHVEKLRAMREAYNEVRTSVTEAFRPDLFSGGIGNLLGGLAGGVSNLQLALNALPKLKKEGASGQFLQQLFTSGNADLIASLAGGPASQVAQAQAQFSQIQSLSAQLGTQVANATATSGGHPASSADIAALKAEIVALRKEISTHPKRIGAESAKALDHTAASAKRRPARR